MSIQKRELSGSRSVYDVRVSYPDPTSGERRWHRKAFPTRKEAAAYEREWKTAQDKGRAMVPARIATRAYLEEWLRDVVAVGNERTTHAAYRHHVERYIAPRIGDVALADLSPLRVQRFVAELVAAPCRFGGTLSPATVRGICRTLHSALASAVASRRIASNPADGATLPKLVPVRRMPSWTAEEAARFLEVAREDAHEPLWSLAVYTGMRRAELLGLRWRDIDFAGGALTVSRTRTVAGTVPVTKGTKSGRTRHIPLAPAALALLADWRLRQAAHIEECHDAYRDQDLVCCSPYGDFWYPGTPTARFKKLVALAGVPAINLHRTRHTFASLALRAGEPLAAVSEVLGHADPRTTLSAYQDIKPDQRRQVSGTVAALIMAQSGTDVPSPVPSKMMEAEKAPSRTGVQEGEAARPTGLEPVTFRSGSSPLSHPLPLGTKRRRPTKHGPDGLIEAKSDGAAAG